jgi:hypothetical protein
MILLFAYQASMPDGTVYRLAFGWSFHPLAWLLARFR